MSDFFDVPQEAEALNQSLNLGGAITLPFSAPTFWWSNLMDSITAWQKHIEKARKQHAAKVPASGFWMMVGTFGDKAESIMVGKQGRQSPITPIRLHKPQEITLDLLKTIFVGKPALSGMADYLEQSRDWLGAWKAREERQHANGNGGGKSPSVPAANEPEFDDGYIPGVDDEIPF